MKLLLLLLSVFRVRGDEQPAQVQVWKSNLTFELQTELCMRLSIDHSVVKSQDSGFPKPHINGTFITTHIIMNRVYFHF